MFLIAFAQRREEGTSLNLTGFLAGMVASHGSQNVCAVVVRCKSSQCELRKTPLAQLLRGREPKLCFIGTFGKEKHPVPEPSSGDCESQVMRAHVVGCIHATASIPARSQVR